MFLFSPNGLFDPIWCRNSRRIIVIAVVVNGIKKSNEKNRVRVVLSTAYPTMVLTIVFIL